MKFSVRSILFATIATACLFCCPMAEAKKPGGGGGVDGASYAIVELPNMDPDSGLLTQDVSDVSADGTVYVGQEWCHGKNGATARMVPRQEWCHGKNGATHQLIPITGQEWCHPPTDTNRSHPFLS